MALRHPGLREKHPVALEPAPRHQPQAQKNCLCSEQLRDSWRGLFTDLPTLSVDQWVLEIRLLHALVAPIRSRPNINPDPPSHLSPQHGVHPAQVGGCCPRLQSWAWTPSFSPLGLPTPILLTSHSCSNP